MINRRSLRVKAFKNLYAYESSKGANYHLALDRLNEKFSPDLNSMEVADKDDLRRKKDLAIKAIDQQLQNTASEIGEEVQSEVLDAIDFMHQLNKKDFKSLNKNLSAEADRVSEDHIMILSVLEELAFVNKKLSDEKKSLANVLGEKAVLNTNLYDNRVVEKLRKDQTFQKLKIKYKIHWDNHTDTIRDWYKGILKKDETYKEYYKKEKPDYADDWNIADYICRAIVMKNDVFSSFFEDIDLDWLDNKPIVKSLVQKTIKSMKEEESEVQIADISYNWEDDSAYVQELFEKTVEQNDYIESLLKEKLQNWDIERVALTDKVLLKLAIAEMLYFPSIPTKVTINEFIEISKVFSTPKSKSFLNGILDTLSIDLKERGIIRKSGRGILDNR